MKAISLLVFILAFFSQDTMAAIFGPEKIKSREICENIHQTFNKSPTSEICNDVISQYKGVPPFVYNSCENIIARYREKPEGAKNFCMSKLRDIVQEESPDILMPSMGHLQQRNATATPSLQQSLAMGQCGQNSVNDFTCRIDTDLITPDLNSILATVRDLPISTPVSEQNFSQSACDCLENSLNEAQINKSQNPNSVNNSLKREKERINDLIYNAAGKKLINDFASNLEDVNFYLTNNVNALGGNDNSANLQCNNFDEIQKKINDTCSQNGVSQDIRTERMTTLLNAFGDFNNESSPETIFNQLQHNIMNYQLDPSKVFPGRSDTFTRQAYDRFRYGHSKSQPQVTFVNEVMDKLLDDSVLGPRILALIESGKKPGHAIFNILKDKSDPDNIRILNQISEKHKDISFYKNLKIVINSESSEELKTFIITAFDMATDMHPSIKAVLRDRNLFLSTRERMHLTGNHSLIDILDSSQGQLPTYFKEKCEKIKNDFATAICVPNNDFLALTDREDLNRLLSTVHSQLNPALKDLLLCRMPETPAAPGIFTRLAFNMGDKFNMADYYLMKVNPTTATASTFTRIAYGFQGSDAKTYKELTRIAESGDKFRVPATNRTTAEVVTTPEIASTEESMFNSQSQKLYEKPENTVPEAPSTNYITPTPAATPVTAESQESNIDARSALREFLANKANEEEVEQHLNQTSSKDHEELLRLRQELTSNKSRMMELLMANEQMKRDLQDNLRYPENEVSEKAAPEVREIRTSNSQSTSEVQSSAVPTEFFSQSRTIASSPTTSTSSGSDGGTSGISSGVSRTIVSSNENETAVAVNNNGSGAIVIEAGTIQGNGPTAREDINAKVITYLQESQPDIETLRQLKESGVILKFRVLEEGREVLKEMRVEYALLSPEARQLLEQKIGLEERNQELNAARRASSFAALKNLLGIQTQSQN